MSEKLRKRLGKRGRVDESVDNIVNTAYFNVTTDLMGKDVSDEYPNVEVPIRKVISTTINEDNIHDFIKTDVSQLRENTAWKAMAVRCLADMRRRRKTLIDSGCNRSIFNFRIFMSVLYLSRQQKKRYTLLAWVLLVT